MQKQRFKVFRGELKDKIVGKALRIAAYRKIEVACGHAIEVGKVLIDHHFLPANQIDAACDALDGDDGLGLGHVGIQHGARGLSRNDAGAQNFHIRNE